jgi:hypothetical protein
MRRFLSFAVVATMVLLLGGCATHKIDTSRLSPPRSVVIEDVPAISPIVVLMRPALLNVPAFYFSEQSDPYYTEADPPPRVALNVSFTAPVSFGTAVGVGAAGGLVAAMINQVVAESAKNAAGFPDLARAAMKEGDLRTSLMTALRTSLEAKGIEVRIDPSTNDSPRRPRWSGKDPGGKDLRPARPDSAPVDADLLVQLAPIASYGAIGLAHPYSRKVGIAVAIYNGRTREFIGWQAIRFDAPEGEFQYMTYEKLAADVDKAAPALRSALLSLVPQIAGIISAERPR